MSGHPHDPASRDSFADGLVAAARSERPREGARTRAVTAALAELSPAVAQAEEGFPPEVSATWSRFVLRASVGVAAAACVACVAMGLVVKHQQDEAAVATAAQAAELAAQKAQTDKLIAELEAQTETLASLQSAVHNAKDDAARAAAVAQLDLARQAQEAANARVRAAFGARASAGGAGRAAKPACNCTPGDPLCSCIP